MIAYLNLLLTLFLQLCAGQFVKTHDSYTFWLQACSSSLC